MPEVPVTRVAQRGHPGLFDPEFIKTMEAAKPGFTANMAAQAELAMALDNSRKQAELTADQAVWNENIKKSATERRMGWVGVVVGSLILVGCPVTSILFFCYGVPLAGGAFLSVPVLTAVVGLLKRDPEKGKKGKEGASKPDEVEREDE